MTAPGASNPLRGPARLRRAGVPGRPVRRLRGGMGRKGLTGLSARDIAMNVALPEVDGRRADPCRQLQGRGLLRRRHPMPHRRLSRARRPGGFRRRPRRQLGALRRTPGGRKVALVLANYPNKDGRLANGVGLDTPAATVHVLRLLRGRGLPRDRNAPADSDALMARYGRADQLAAPTGRSAQAECGCRWPTTDRLWRSCPGWLR